MRRYVSLVERERETMCLPFLFRFFMVGKKSSKSKTRVKNLTDRPVDIQIRVGSILMKAYMLKLGCSKMLRSSNIYISYSNKVESNFLLTFVSAWRSRFVCMERTTVSLYSRYPEAAKSFLGQTIYLQIEYTIFFNYCFICFVFLWDLCWVTSLADHFCIYYVFSLMCFQAFIFMYGT